jgi:hypothetical protein
MKKYEAKPSEQNSDTRISLANPYLLACGFIAAGMDGVEKKAKFLGFTNENSTHSTSPASAKKDSPCSPETSGKHITSIRQTKSSPKNSDRCSILMPISLGRDRGVPAICQYPVDG